MGAIRHKGFIPWDDDIDVSMPRGDYEKFLSLGNAFHTPYFLQIPGEDNGYFFANAKVRNSRTTAVGVPFRYEKFNQGMCIDVFALDNVDIPTGRERYEQIRRLLMENSTCMRRSNLHPTAEDVRRIAECGDVDPKANLQKINELACENKLGDSHHMGNMICTVYPFEKHVWPKELFSGTLDWPFEGGHFKVPIGYDCYLRTQYGDYWQLPPDNERTTCHPNVLYDTDLSYQEYLSKMDIS